MKKVGVMPWLTQVLQPYFFAFLLFSINNLKLHVQQV